MKTIRNLLISTLILFGAWTASAQNITTIGATNGTNVVLSAPYHLLTIQALGTVAQTLNFYDSGTTNLFYTNDAYVTRTSYNTNITNIITATTTGIPQTNIYTGIWSYSVTNAAATNTFPILATIILPANFPISMVVNDRLIRGLAVTTTNNATISVTYKDNVGR